MAEVRVDRVEDPHAEHDECDADNAAHDRVHPVGQQRPERQRREAEHRHDQRMPEGIKRPEYDRPALLRYETTAVQLDRRTRRHGRRDAVPAVRGMDLEFCRTAVRVVVGACQMFRDVPLLAGIRRGRRARDVGDRGDVVPVDPVADPEHQRRR